MDEGESAKFGFTANYSGSSSSPIVADVEVGGRWYALEGTPVQSGSNYAVNLETVPFPAGGATTSEVKFRLCTTAACTGVYPGSSKTFTVNLDVKLGDWGMFQRNPAHTGYVAARYNYANFSKAWEWVDSNPITYIRPPAATRDRILITAGRGGGMAYDKNGHLYSFDPRGQLQWSFDLGEQAYISGPSIANGLVHVTSMVTSSNNNPQWVFDVRSGSFLNQMKFASQWHDFNQPTAADDQVFVAAGYTGGMLYAYDARQGTLLWELERAGSSWADGKAVAIDDQNVYYPAGAALDIIDRATGTITQSIADPEVKAGFVSTFFSAPVLGDDGLIFLFSGEKRFLSSANIIALSQERGPILWRSNSQYTTAFAYADDTIFAVRNDAFVLAALDAKTGAQKWATPIPVDTGLYGERSFHGNVVVTENLVFVSDHDTTWAIDRKADGHPIVWEAPTGGRLIITPNNQLLTTGVREFRKLTAYNLQ
ncbi:outer membrane protein assembly factor BamB family protein [Qipengyuania atrilutea]|uniref:PQQ-binding-like beta-propeller repeat protein n=1 Tax=Qipengyuania atrilutea TaxID=2744473 RepID=A0A850GWW5_9SPHN|nr:PQQ-binding-like beta-propeller repeat protein [Actirhodobacter atriluteus]NVD44064.1 PQQ-binding-like beta-propeller repeat protein [Actirhodobacter atriluteus]